MSANNTLKSITSFRQVQDEILQDWDKTPLIVAEQDSLGEYTYPGELKQWTQELQLVGKTERLHYVGGLYYFQSKSTVGADRTFFCGTVFGCTYSRDWGSSKRSAYSIYGQVDFDITETLTLSAGARYNNETMEMWSHSVLPLRPVGYGEVTSDRVTPLVSLGYRFNNQLNLYAKYSEGFQSGGLAGTVINGSIPSFEPEINKAVELGAKMSSSDGRAHINAAVFQSKITDMQLTVYALGDDGIPRNFMRNAGKTTSQGLELEGQWSPLDGVLLQASYGYLDTEYDEYIDAGVNRADNRSVPFAPENTFSALVDVRLAQTSYGSLRAIIDYTYTDEMYSGPPAQLARSGPGYDPTKSVAGDTLLESVGITNARLVLSDMHRLNGNVNLALWVRNLTDEEHVDNYLDFGPGFGELIAAYWTEPRTYGVSLEYRW